MGEAPARLFDAMADSYDVLEPWYEHLYAVLHARLRRDLVLPGGPGRVLDAGCGTGFQTAIVEGLGHESHGLDLSAGLLAVARARLERPRLVRGRLEALPYPDGIFDAVVCCGSTLSFLSDPAAGLAEIGRVLRPGGLLVLEVEHRFSLDLAWMALGALAGDALGYGVRLADVARLLRRPTGQGAVIAYPGYGPLRLFTWPEVRALLRAAGLEPSGVTGLHMLTNLIPSTVLHRAWLPRPLAALYRLLCAGDDLLRRLSGTHALANSLLIQARRRDPAPAITGSPTVHRPAGGGAPTRERAAGGGAPTPSPAA